MSWQGEMTTIVRQLIYDVDPSNYTYSDERLETTILVAAQLVSTEIDFEKDQYNFNHADSLVHEMDISEKKKFKKSRVENENPKNDRIVLITHIENGGVGAAIATGV